MVAKPFSLRKDRAMSHSLRLRESRPLTVDRFPPPPKLSSQSTAKKAGKTENPRRALRFERTLPFRCIGWTAFSMGVGYALLFAFGATLRPLATSALLAHFLSGAALPTAWLSLVLARLPSLGLLSVAGLTRFSGGLTSALLCYRRRFSRRLLFCAVRVSTSRRQRFFCRNLPILDTIFHEMRSHPRKAQKRLQKFFLKGERLYECGRTEKRIVYI